MGRRRPITAGLAIVVAAALVGAGCGGEEEPQLHAVGPTQACLEEAGLEVTRDDLDFVASTATAGALRADLGENEVTVSFGASEAEAARTATAYRDFAGEDIPIEHVLARDLNAVLVWNAPPADEERGRVHACLSG